MAKRSAAVGGLIIALVFAAGTNSRTHSSSLTSINSASSDSPYGTWRGESICVGNRPACKDEIVVYRFEQVAGKPGLVLLLADKIINGERMPMYKLEFQYDQANRTLSCEFTRRQTHGLWQYTISGDSMEGTLVLLPHKELGRRIKVKRVTDADVPPAPARESYEGNAV